MVKIFLDFLDLCYSINRLIEQPLRLHNRLNNFCIKACNQLRGANCFTIMLFHDLVLRASNSILKVFFSFLFLSEKCLILTALLNLDPMEISIIFS